jgi:hypothetical protein
MSNRRLRTGKRGVRKYGRNQAKCALYRSMKKREKSHIRRIEKHLKTHSNDRKSKKALKTYKKLLSN